MWLNIYTCCHLNCIVFKHQQNVSDCINFAHEYYTSAVKYLTSFPNFSDTDVTETHGRSAWILFDTSLFVLFFNFAIHIDRLLKMLQVTRS